MRLMDPPIGMRSSLALSESNGGRSSSSRTCLSCKSLKPTPVRLSGNHAFETLFGKQKQQSSSRDAKCFLRLQR